MKIKCPRCKGAGTIESRPLAELMERDGVTQKELASSLDMGQSGVSRMLTTGIIPRYRIRPLCERFRVSSDQLLGREALIPRTKKKVRPKAHAKKT